MSAFSVFYLLIHATGFYQMYLHHAFAYKKKYNTLITYIIPRPFYQGTYEKKFGKTTS